MVFIRINFKLRDAIARAEQSSLVKATTLIDKASCLAYLDFKNFVQSLSEPHQTEIASIVKFDDLVMDVQHANEMKAILRLIQGFKRIRRDEEDAG
jgi:hypothetical protein